ncbi:MAG: hypothetical protein ACK4Z4_04605 [Ferrovibrio sp.]
MTRNQPFLLIAFGTTVGLIIGILSGVMLAEWLEDPEFNETIWGAAWSAVAGMVGSAIAVAGAIIAAQRQIEAHRLENIRREQLVKKQETERQLTEMVEALSDIAILLRGLWEVIPMVVDKVKSYDETPNVVGLRVRLELFIRELDSFLATPVPSVALIGIDARSNWMLVRFYIAPMREEVWTLLAEHPDHIHKFSKTLIEQPMNFLVERFFALRNNIADRLEATNNRLKASE